MAPRTQRITDEIFQVGGMGFTGPKDAAVYLVRVDGRAALVDAGCGEGTEQLLKNVEAAGVAPEAIELLLLTHCHFDHTGGAHELRARLGCTVVAHALDAAFIEAGDDEVSAAAWYDASLTPCVVDRKLAGPAATVMLGDRAITAIHIPGHSPGSLAYAMESCGQTVIFAQDVHGPLHPSLLSNRDDYLLSLRSLLDLRADILCEGHFGVCEGKGAVADFIRRFLDEAPRAGGGLPA